WLPPRSQSPPRYRSANSPAGSANGSERGSMTSPTTPSKLNLLTTRRSAVGLVLSAPLLAGCAGMSGLTGGGDQPPGPSGPPQEGTAIGKGQVKVGLILPLSGAGNAGIVGQSMKNAAEMALAEFQNPDLQLLVKD